MLSRTLSVLALAVALSATAMAQSGKTSTAPTSFTELSDTPVDVVDRLRAVTTHRRYNPLISTKGPVTFFADRTACEASASALVAEDFNAAVLPIDNVESVETPLSSFTSGAVYAAGDIEAGLVVASQGATIALEGDVVVLGAGFAGIPSTSTGVGANFFGDATRLDFRPGANTVCFDFISFNGGGEPIQISVFDTDGNLLGTQERSSDATGFQHSGVSSASPIGSIVVFDAPSDGTFVDDVSFELSGPAPADAPEVPELYMAMGSGTTVGGPTFARSGTDFFGACVVATGDSGGNVPYDTFTFTPEVSGLHIVDMQFPDHDGYVGIYSDFDPSDACANLIAQDDDAPLPVGTAGAQAFGSYMAGVEYTVVVSGFGNGDAGSYTGTVFGPRAAEGGNGGGGNTVDEDGDAPDGLAGVQDATGDVDQILGTMEPNDIADCYAITIADIDAFSATTANTMADPLIDSQIQLFTAGLEGVVFNDDTVGGASPDFTSTIPAGTLSSADYAPGNYVICITEWRIDARNAADENIFTTEGTGRAIRFASAPNGDNVLTSWFEFNAVVGGTTYQLDMTGLGDIPATPIADARAAGTGNEVTIEGTVTRAMGAFAYVQDATGAITIRQTSGEFFDDVADGTIASGTRVTITGTTSEFRGLFQINNDDLASYSVDGTGPVPAPQMINIAELNANGEAYEAELVQVINNTTGDMGTFEASTNYTVNDRSADGTLRVPNADDSMIDGTDIPGGPFTFTGVVGQFTFDVPATNGYQLLAIADGDIMEQFPMVTLPVTFEEDIPYELQDFAGTTSMLVPDPEDADNTVVETFRAGDGACFAGTTVADVTGFVDPIPFAPGDTKMSVRVWSPEAGVRVLFKVEQVGAPEIFVETLAMTTQAGAWEFIEFDFANPMPNALPIDFDAVYNKATIFFDFTCDLDPAPPASPDRTYYWDDVAFGPAPEVGDTVNENGDAPDALAAAPQNAMGFVERINGEIDPGVDLADCYAITITDVDAFSATTENSPPNADGLNLDTQLQLFTAGLEGAVFNDDTPDTPGLFSTIPAGALTGRGLDPGDYVLCVTEWDVDAKNAAGEDIFEEDAFETTEYPSAPNGDNVLAQWDPETNEIVGGRPYRIDLTGTGEGAGASCEDLTIALSPVTDYVVGSEGGFVRMVMEIVNDSEETCEFEAWGFSM
ncbi:MAG: hypothetical protein AAGI52_05995, partial [Bacteroidota bacterium]